ncbi:hypothetical protein [Alloactinosynnema sp. L-07]|uniref:hypothetical protein n=1 Tax=Alloactinosynnema sp. L-07 TaxID=1653480 RepID=UPI00065F0492|nr:hypothetical protein [Alloactinosynnema sp. L-07]CRK55618.1 hypothetical protein [Alloactinosynnema sp. L-07]
MTKHKTFKTKVRTRMAKTGESYAAARRQLITPLDEMVTPEATRNGTGREREEWFALLDKWGATTRTHTQIARWLFETHGVTGWWAQSITVAYEQARGMREPGQRCDGKFAASVSKTMTVAPELATAAFTDEVLREQWLPDVDLTLRTVRPGKTVRALWPDGRTQINMSVDVKGPDKVQVAVAIEKLEDAASAAEMREFWRERIADLKKVIEG